MDMKGRRAFDSCFHCFCLVYACELPCQSNLAEVVGTYFNTAWSLLFKLFVLILQTAKTELNAAVLPVLQRA